jgi:general secretion pathway protein K
MTAAAARPGDRGFALLIVLWALVLLALIVAELGTSGRMESKIARNLMANAQAEAAADGALHQAIFHLADGSNQAWQPDGVLRRLAVGPVPVDLRIEDEVGKVNPNLADPALLQALLVVLGADQRLAQTVTQGIVDWRGGNPPDQQAGVAQRYQAAGLRYQPSFAPFESVDDVGLVLGLPPDLAARLEPHLSVHQIGVADPARADPVVARALAQLPGATSQATPAVPMAYRSVMITAVARPVGGLFTRRAVVRIGPGLPRGYALLTWDAPGAE